MLLKTFFLFLIPVAPVFCWENTQDDFELVKKGLTEVLRTGNKPDYFTNALKTYQLPHLFRDKMESVFDNDQVCTLCSIVVDIFVDIRLHGSQREDIVDIIEYICVALGLEEQRVCQGSVNINADIFLYIIDNYPNISSSRVCGSVLQSFGCSTGDGFDWSIKIPTGDSKMFPKTLSGGNTFKILQLSDIHYDANYKIGGKADCGEPVCCQSDQGEGETLDASCGYWTDYRDADVPWHLVEETIRQVKTHDFDFVYYTGDIISHRVWQTTTDNNTKTITKLYSFFKESFDVPVFAVLGNHEPHPLNVWPGDYLQDDSLSETWLLELAADQWSKLIGEDVSSTALQGGYYSVSPKPGFRVIGINGNLGYTSNWWLIYNDVDPFNQLQWLADELKKAEDNNESVHILSHVPTSEPSCLKVWAREYRRIVERFSSTITGQFNGHTHRDEFHVYYNSSEPTQAVGVAFNGASVTPYSSSNPSYKIYTVDSSTYELLDYEEWTFNLTLANLDLLRSPDWYKLYSFVEAYGVNNLHPDEVDKVLYKMVESDSLLADYFRFKFRDGDDGIKGGCDDECKTGILCEVAQAQYGDDTQCNKFIELYKKLN